MTDDILPVGDIYIAGEWRKGSGDEIVSTFPADGTVNRRLAGASAGDCDEAIARARAAQSDPAWAGLRPHQRARYLHAIADGIDRSADRISLIQTRDTGKTLRETAALAASAAMTFRYFAAVCETADDDLTAQRGTAMALSVHEALGVVAAITPWNSPIASDAQKVAPALAAGNAVVLKPASWSPLTALELARIIAESGLPAGLFSVLPGSGREIGNRLVEHPDISKVSFTGGTATGKALARKAAEKLMPVSLELGGKSPTIVFDDADIDLALSGILYGIFSSTGQSCIAGSRLFVQRSIYEGFVRRLVAATKMLRVGHPMAESTQVAPLIHPDHRAEVEGHVARALAEGGRLLTGGKRPEDPGLSAGSYYLPTIIDGLPNGARLCRDEVFGPVLAVLPFDDAEDVIAQGNDSDYGLACGIWTRDFPQAWRIAGAIRAGTVWINTYKQFSVAAPFGGDGSSGMGREKGRQGLRAYQRQKSVYVDLSGMPHPWAAAAVASV